MRVITSGATNGLTFALMAGSLALLCSCAASTRMAPEARPPMVERQEPTLLIGLWISGLEVDYVGDGKLIGLILESASLPDDETVDTMQILEAMTSAPIIATFRSRREAWATAEELEPEFSIAWYMAHFDGEWSFHAKAPPTYDSFSVEQSRDVALGDADSGLRHNPEVHILPAPLQQRGIAVAISSPKANPVRTYMPADLTASIFTSWQDMKERIGSTSVRFYHWKGADMVWIDRADLDQLR